MDEVDHGRQIAPIGINVLSPLSDSYYVPEINLMLQTKDTGEMIIRLDNSKDYLDELTEILRVNEYTKTLNMDLLPENKQIIIIGKKSEERPRRQRVRDNIEYALKNATFYINGEKVDVKGGTVKERINNGMKILTESIYTKLSYIEKFITSPVELQDILNIDNEQITMGNNLLNNNDLAIKEVYDYIKFEDDMRKQTRVKPVLDYFSVKPYGWNELDILGIILTLLKDQKINLRYQGENLTSLTPNLVQIITKSSEQDRIIVSIRQEIDEKLLRSVKAIIKELWDKTNIPDDEDGLASYIRELIDKQIAEINNYLDRYEGRKYPGKSLLEKGLEYFEGLQDNIDNIVFFKKLVEMEDDLLNWEDDMAYVRSFFSNQKDIFDNGLKIQNLYKENADYLNDEKVKEAYDNLTKVLEDYMPYGKIKNIPEYAKIIDEGIDEILNKKKEESRKQVEEDLKYLDLMSDHPGVKQTTKESYQKIYKGLKNNIESNTEILKIEGIKSRSFSFRTDYEQQIIREIDEYEPPVDPVTPPQVQTREIKQVKLKDLTNIKNLKTEAQIDVFLQELGKVLKRELKEHDIEFID